MLNGPSFAIIIGERIEQAIASRPFPKDYVLYPADYYLTIMDSSNDIRNGNSFSYDTPYYFPGHHNTGVLGRLDTWTLLLQEARAVSLWSCVSTLIRVTLACLALLAGEIETMRNGTSSSSSSSISNVDRLWFLPPSIVSTPALQEWLFQASGVASLLLCLLPAKVALHQAPGFSFANPWLLLWVRDKTGVIPNIPTRACEYVMGRIRLGELLVIIPIHVVCIVSTFSFLRNVLPERVASQALDPIEYSNDGNPWIVDLVREVFATAMFTVLLMVLPVLFQLNRIPRWLVTIVLYPLFNYSVHDNGQASSFSPNVVFALAMLGHRPLPTGVRLMGSLLGGLVGGKIMQLYFPDSNYHHTNKVA